MGSQQHYTLNIQSMPADQPTPPRRPKSTSMSALHNRLLQLERNAITERKNLINSSRKELNRSWRNLCSILKQDEATSQRDHNAEEGAILDACLQLIVRERISLEKENLEVQRIRALYHKSAANCAYTQNGNKACLRAWKAKANHKINKCLKSQ